MLSLIEMRQIKFCSIEQWNRLVSKGVFEVGMKIQDSPVGPGKITGINGRGYPMVNHVAVTCLITEDSIVYGDYVEWILKKAKLKAKEENRIVKKMYKNPNPNIALEVPGIGPINNFWYLQGFGPIPDAKFCERYKTPMTWKIDFARPDTPK